MLLKHDCLKKKKKEHIQVWYINSVTRPVNVQLIFSFWKKKKQKKNTKARTHLYSAAVSKVLHVLTMKENRCPFPSCEHDRAEESMGPPPPRLGRGRTSARAPGCRASCPGPRTAHTGPMPLSETSRRRGQQWGWWWWRAISGSRASSGSSSDTALPTERGRRKGHHFLQNQVCLVSGPSFWLYLHTQHLCHQLHHHNHCH